MGVLAKNENTMISLVPKKQMMPKAESVTSEYQPSGPSLYIHDIKLPVKPEQLGAEMTAKVKLVPTSISQRDSKNNGSKYTYDFEVKSIQFV